MSKSIFKIGLAIVGIVLAIPTVGASLGLTAIALAAVEVGIALASTLLLGPSTPKGNLTQTALSRLYATLVTTEPRKWWLGITSGAADVRYQTYTGSKQEYYHQLIAHASHQVQSIDEIWIDNEKAWTKIGGVQGRYVGWLTVTTRELATSANGIAIDSVWTASCTLTGCAYSYLQYKLLDTANSSNASPFQSGISGRLTFRGKGAPTYDPRLDSTVVGGSGTQLAGTQSTWAWSDTGSRNPALQLLWYLLGWKINGKIALGMGLPPARIDLASFITAANHCDETVTLAAGGSEPRYRGDGLISEGDDRSAVVQHLCQTMNATLRDSGGKIALQVINNDLATPIATFGLNDILGSEQYEQTQPLNNYFNIVRGRRVDPTDQALYQLTDFPQAVLSSPDGIDRIQTMDYPLVQSNGQAQRLAKLSLKRAQYQAKYTASFGSNAWAVSLGNVVQINHSGMNWTNKLMRVVAQSIGQNGQVKMTLLEESTDVYTWAAEDVAGTTAGTPTVVVPTSLPLGSVAPGADVTSAQFPSITGSGAFAIAADSSGTITTTLPFTRQFTAKQGTTDVSSTTNWVLGGAYDTLGLTVDNTPASGTRGLVTVNAKQITATTTNSTGSGTATLTATTPNGSTTSINLVFTKTNAPAVSGGGTGASSGAWSVMSAPASTATAALSTEIIVRSDSAGKIKVSMDVGYTGAGGTGTKTMWCNASYATTSGGALTDLFADTNAAIALSADFYDVGIKAWSASGSVSMPLTQFTMPAANTDYYFKVKGRYSAASVSINSTNIHVQQV